MSFEMAAAVFGIIFVIVIVLIILFFISLTKW